ncbi:MAG: alpha/beta fold hydrolase [Deltaproteobacteria bacterium]|nr:alpha/beta fold hydrolase [Deltaproteobacteria bacterium]MBW2398409.1 alpha/beta fold hydrolase [Deltaproteobacteria bacterium]
MLISSQKMLSVLLGLTLLVAGCATPVGVERVDPRTAHRALTRNVLSSGHLSEPSVIAFEQFDLRVLLDSEPDRALAALHDIMRAQSEPKPDVLFALAEGSFQHAEVSGDRAYFLASVVYAYAFLFPEDHARTPSPYDPRYRLACDLYNRGLTAGFAIEGSAEVVFQTATYALPFGQLAVTYDATPEHWGARRLSRFVPVADLEVRGLRNRYRHSGIGAPLAADAPLAEQAVNGSDFLPQKIKVPLNALLRIDEPRRQIRGERIEAAVELRIGFDAYTVEIEGREVPLELEGTAHLAYMLAESSIWEREYKGFIFGDLTHEETRLLGLRPYVRGRTPVVLVHGTASSAGRWADMLNDLGSDPRIRENYQFWFFNYDTGNPVAYSAMLLRESLRAAVQRFDPDGTDPALREMVLVGHSQGGLLVKMTSVDSGDRFWNEMSRVPLEELDVEPETRELLEGALFMEPEPYVGRVVFIATPHRGSFRAGNRVAHWLSGLVKLPSQLGRAGIDLLNNEASLFRVQGMKRLPSSVDNMTPGNSLVKVLSSLPVSADIPAHSIIAVKGDGPVEGGNDGIVEYSSAHIDEAVSELVVRSHHSVQDHPHAIEEVRRILLLHRGLD